MSQGTRRQPPQLFETATPAGDDRLHRRPAQRRIIRLIHPWRVLRGRTPLAHWCPNEPGPNGAYLAACGVKGLALQIPHGDKWVACAKCHDRSLKKGRRRDGPGDPLADARDEVRRPGPITGGFKP